MKCVVICLIFYLCLLTENLSAQTSVLYEESFTENTTDQVRFSIYLDTAFAYLYRDIEKTGESLEACQDLLDEDVVIEDSLRVEYISTSIFHKYVKLEPLEAYKVIVDNEEFIKRQGVSDEQRSRFNYLKSFTFMSLGDHEAAQKAYYRGVEEGKASNDTMTVIDNYYSLGQLFYDQEDYDQSIKYYREVLSYIDIYDIPKVTIALTYLEKAMALLEIEKYEDAKESLLVSMKYVEEFDLDFVRPNILKEKGQLHYLLNEVDSIESVLKEMKALDKGAQDVNYKINLYTLQSKMYRSNGEYNSALLMCDKILDLIDSTNIEDQVIVHSNAFEIHEKRGDYKSAYHHLQISKELEDKIANDKKRQKTAYLKIRYDSDQKEKDNALLKASLFEQKANQNLLYGGLALATMLLLGLFAAFKQKARYSKHLEETVSIRTKSLKESNNLLNESNVELEEMNRILSHDLKEPIRSIVSFSELVEREQTLLPKSKQYLEYVKSSGKQLDKLIKDVNLLRDTDSLISRISTYNVNELLREVVEDLQVSSNKIISLVCPPVAPIKGAKDVMRNVFSGIIQNSINFNQNELVRIEVSYMEEEKMHSFHIKDNGIGIEKEYHDQIFGLFKRLHNRADFIGSGLGLSIVKRFVDSLGGSVSVLDSQLGVGTTIEVKHPKSN